MDPNFNLFAPITGVFQLGEALTSGMNQGNQSGHYRNTDPREEVGAAPSGWSSSYQAPAVQPSPMFAPPVRPSSTFTPPVQPSPMFSPPVQQSSMFAPPSLLTDPFKPLTDVVGSVASATPLQAVMPTRGALTNPMEPLNNVVDNLLLSVPLPGSGPGPLAPFSLDPFNVLDSISKSITGKNGRSPIASIDPFGLLETVFGPSASGPLGNIGDFLSSLPIGGGISIPTLNSLKFYLERAPEARDDLVRIGIERRMQLWKAMLAAISGLRPPGDLFLFPGSGRSFILSANHLTMPPIPLQLMHSGPGAIDDATANQLCANLGPQRLLEELNAVLGTRYTAYEFPGLAECMQHFSHPPANFNFGTAYGILRPSWGEGRFDYFLYNMEARRSRDEELRISAIQEGKIVTPRIPPRRVWDLYSNRVLPFWVIGESQADPPPETHEGQQADQPTHSSIHTPSKSIPSNLWAVSHAWAHESDRHYVPTIINNFEWPVPLPLDSTLENVRIELLNMGAEYVWLDVLCLKQEIPAKQNPRSSVQLPRLTKKQREEANRIRRDEAKLDVPTIGHVYQYTRYQTVITYFNGLGRPFFIGPNVIRAERHWINRAWTLQETTPTWLPAGLTLTIFDTNTHGDQVRPDLFDQIVKLCSVISLNPPDIFSVIGAVQDRCFSTPADQIGAIGYLLKLPVVPIYDSSADVEESWSRLVDCLLPKHRTDLLLLYPLRGDTYPRWRPSWYQLMTLDVPAAHWISYSPEEFIHADNESPQSTYSHTARVFKKGLVYLTGKRRGVLEISLADNLPQGYALEANEAPKPSVSASDEDEYEDEDREQQEPPAPATFRFDIVVDHNQPIARGTYFLAGVAKLEYWVIGRCVDGVEDQGGQAHFTVEKTSAIRIKNPDDRQRLHDLQLGFINAKVSYI